MTADPPTAAPVLVVNAGSSSIKLALCDSVGRRLWQEQRSWGSTGVAAAAAEPAVALEHSIDALLEHWLGPLLQAAEPPPALVVHRLVHGGSRFTAPTALTASVRMALADLVPLAPLHNGPALSVIRWLAERSGKEQWACFDTAFHASLAEEAFTYAIPQTWRQQGLRRFGFHGINHQHVAETAVRSLKPPLRLISCHLGAGCSLCAIAIGGDGVPRSVDTTMGFTPLEGLVMASRSGSVDPGLLLHLLRAGVEPAELDRALNRQSGLLGLSGLSGDMRELRSQAAAGHGGARLAIAVFRHRLLAAIGAMAASLGGVDAIALSGGIGEHDRALVRELQEALRWLAPLRWLVVPADEEGLMVRQCLAARA